MRPPLPLAVPVAASAVRPQWSDLPGSVRSRVQDQLGSEIVAAVSQGSGFTPGFASRVRLADGRRFFVKAASSELDWLLTCYRDEAVKLARIPAAVPAPRVQLVIDGPADGHDWLVLVFDDIDGHPPDRPWRLDQARSALRTATVLSQALTPAPAGGEWAEVVDELPGGSTDWRTMHQLPEWADHVDELADLADRSKVLLAGETLAHLDLRDDNLIIDAHGTAWVCDWNFPAVGPRWVDAVCLAISMYGDGHDVDALLAETGLIGRADGEGVDCLLAVLTAYCLREAAQPDNPTSPYLRAHQAWYATAAGGWLRDRRGWR